jgi:hypothetical protein
VESEEKKSSSKKRPVEESASKKAVSEGRIKRRPLEKMAVFKVAQGRKSEFLHQQARRAFTIQDLKATLMCQERILEMLCEAPTQGMRQEVLRSPCAVNESVLTTKNDPDYLRLSKTRFEINKSYMDVIQKLIGQNKETDDAVIKNEKLGYSLLRGSLERLGPRRWLNDEVLNGYVALINSVPKPVFVMNTFFFTMLEDMHARGDYNFAKLQRILRRIKFNLDTYETLVIPVNVKQCHWFLLRVCFTTYTIQVVDSILCTEGQAGVYASVLERFLVDLSGISTWRIETLESVPQQGNAYDCGLFACVNMELMSRGLPVRYEVDEEFSDDNRKRIAVELMFGQLLTL